MKRFNQWLGVVYVARFPKSHTLATVSTCTSDVSCYVLKFVSSDMLIVFTVKSWQMYLIELVQDSTTERLVGRYTNTTIYTHYLSKSHNRFLIFVYYRLPYKVNIHLLLYISLTSWLSNIFSNPHIFYALFHFFI